MNIEAKMETATEIRSTDGPSNLRAGMEELADFAKDAAALEVALDQLELITGEETRKPVQRLKKDLASFEPRVTVLGQVKAGKTALINSIAGWADLLPSDVNPWTSVVTSLHLCPAEDRGENGASFRFMTEEEWNRLTNKGGRIGELANRAGAEGELNKIRDQIEKMRANAKARLGRNFELLMGQEHEYSYFDKNLLERYICLGDDFDIGTHDAVTDDQGRFADITRSSELYLNCPTVPFRMCIRDTPGVNDTFMMREMVTIQALRDSRICLVVLSATQALTSVDMALLRMISNLKSRDVIIFVNRIDELPDPAAQMVEIEESIRATLKTNNGPEDAELVFGSAYWANMALTGELGRMHASSADALLSYTKAVLGSTTIEKAPSDVIWEFSGLPQLMAAVSKQVITNLGKPFLSKVAASATTIATSQQATQIVKIEGHDFASDMSKADVRAEFDRLAKQHVEDLNEKLTRIFDNYSDRADRAHTNFIERATHSLLGHLETYGDEHVWEYDPAGLRMLLRSAYLSMGNQARKSAQAIYEQAVNDTAQLFYRGFGPAVEGIQLAVPSVPQIPSPVSLGQTIALDFNDSWWTAWWRRTRGYKAFAKKFRDLISAETEDFMSQMKFAQAADIRAELLKELENYLEEQRSILLDLSAGPDRKGDAQRLSNASGKENHGQMLDGTLETLRRYAT
ncbi:dynamin family protein [Roseovarius aestuariivivens]|uniref:dynamin family protein n=1 Tax=Roseovarius aestuariivivens TaxID=1888910 RepID=UPI0010818A5A|nr:dynamin family protein [Roseovarius aestuariivivens]